MPQEHTSRLGLAAPVGRTCEAEGLGGCPLKPQGPGLGWELISMCCLRSSAAVRLTRLHMQQRPVCKRARAGWPKPREGEVDVLEVGFTSSPECLAMYRTRP